LHRNVPLIQYLLLQNDAIRGQQEWMPHMTTYIELKSVKYIDRIVHCAGRQDLAGVHIGEEYHAE